MPHQPTEQLSYCSAISIIPMPAPPNSLATYWSFFWPLMLTGAATVLAVQFQNGTLARYPDAVTELALFAIAHSTFMLFGAALNFIPQLANLFARNPQDTRQSQRFVGAVSTALAALLLLLALTNAGQSLLVSVYELDQPLLDRVCTYLVYLSPVLILNGQRFFINGQLEQARLTGWVTNLNIVFLASTLIMLSAGFYLGASPVITLCGAQAGGALVHLCMGSWIRRRFYQLPEPTVDVAHQTPRKPTPYCELFRFFWPVGTTGVMFALSRPVLYAFLARTPDALISIAALRIAFDFSMLFQQAANQFRSFWVTFGMTDMALKRTFMWLVGGGLTAVMLLVALTPLNGFILKNLLGINQQIHTLAAEVILVMCAVPGVLVWRNYYHGYLLVNRATNAMAFGSTLRVVAIAGSAQVLALLGALDHLSAAWVLVSGFVVETLAVGCAKKVRRSAIGATMKTRKQPA